MCVGVSGYAYSLTLLQPFFSTVRKFRLCCFFLLLLPSLAFGDKIILGGFSKHYMELTFYPNETHPAIGIERNQWEVGIMKNSVNRPSLFVARIEKPWKFKGVDFGYRLGFATSYIETTMPDVNSDNGEPVERLNKLGVMPQAQFIASKEVGIITTEIGLSVVSSLTFKVDY